MNRASRRHFLRFAGAGLAAVPLAGGAQAHGETVPRFTLAMASYTFRKFGLDETLAMTRRLGLTGIAFKDFHLALNSSPDLIRAAASKARDAGLDLYGCGVVYMKTEAEVKQAFEYAKTAGMRLIVGVPAHDLLPLVDRMVRDFDIRVAIHNHGPGDLVYPSPQSAWDRIRGLDSRVGLCLDIGHAQRLGLDPAVEFTKFSKRVLDIHIKDVSAATDKGTTVEIGRGVIDIPKFLRTLKKLNYSGALALEYEKDEGDPLPGASESVGYLRGVIKAL